LPEHEGQIKDAETDADVKDRPVAFNGIVRQDHRTIFVMTVVSVWLVLTHIDILSGS